MALFSRGGGATSVPRSERSEPGPEELGSPAFHHLVTTLDKEPERKYEILDLGPASGNHVEFFSRFRCRFHVASLEETLQKWKQEEDEPPPDPQQLLPLEEEGVIEVVLCWDLLNYLDESGFPILMSHLRRHCADDAWMHAFVHTRAQMPPLPGRFLLSGPERMRWQHDSAETVPAPRYAQRTLERMMPGFRVERSRLLQNGFQEYLFRAR